jgi:hypothetical protein
VLEQIFGSSDSKWSSSKVPENISSSSMHIDRDQEVQSSVQKEKVNSATLGKPDCPVSQTGVFDLGRTKIDLATEDDCSMSSSDDDTIDEYDDQELLLEFQKLISKHTKL